MVANFVDAAILNDCWFVSQLVHVVIQLLLTMGMQWRMAQKSPLTLETWKELLTPRFGLA